MRRRYRIKREYKTEKKRRDGIEGECEIKRERGWRDRKRVWGGDGKKQEKERSVMIG